MLRFVRSLILGLLVGTLAGLYLGWFPFPPDARSSTISDLAQRYRDEYTVMIAAGYASDRDAPGALERLNLLELENIRVYLQRSTERIISTSARDLDDIRLLVGLAHDLDVLTPEMLPFLTLQGDNS